MSIKDHPGWASVIDALTHEEAVTATWDWIMGDNWYGYPDSENSAEMAEATRCEAERLRPGVVSRVEHIISILDKAESRRGETPDAR